MARRKHQTGGYAWGLGYGYDASGNLAAQNYPAGLSIAYAPNTLGQPMQAGNNGISQ